MSQQKYITKYVTADKPSAEIVLYSPQVRRRVHNNGTSCYFPTFMGNITIEATMVTPLCLGLLLVLLFLFKLLQVEASVQEALIYSARRTASYSSLSQDSGVLFAESEAYFRKVLKDTTVESKFIRNGTLGISLKESKFEDDYITLCAEYKFRLPGLGIEKVCLPILQSATSRKWRCASYQDGDYVYVTTNGEVYHKNTNCSSIKLKIEGVEKVKVGELRNNNGEKYSACSFCAEKNMDEKWVYITPYGAAYHTDLGCLGLRRSLHRIPFKDVGERRACKICWE